MSPISRNKPLPRSTKPIKRTVPLKRGSKPIKRGFVKSTPSTLEKRDREQDILDAARREAAYRDARFGLGGKCLPCFLGVLLKNGERGTTWATSYNHCIARSRIPGEENWKYLHSAINLAPACEGHHEEHDRHPEWWLPLMQKVFGYAYADEPFAVYLTEVYQRGVTYDYA